MNRLTFIVLLFACACQAAPIAKIYRWDSRVEDGPAMALEPTRGETMVLQPRLLTYGVPMDLTDAESVTMLYKATGSTNVYPVAGGVLLATNGQVQILWTSSNELAATAYTFDVLVSSLTTTVVGARGTIKFRNGPAAGAQFSTNTPIHILDFASAALLNIDLSPFLRTSDLTGLVAGVTSITNTADILPSGDGTGAQGLSFSSARLASLARADLALTNAGDFATAAQGAKADDWQSKSGTVTYTTDARLTDARTPLAHTQDWSTVSGTPTTLAGYGVTAVNGSNITAGTISSNAMDAATLALFTSNNASAWATYPIVNPYQIQSSPSITLTKSIINSATNGELRLTLTNSVTNFSFDMSTFYTNESGTWAVSLLGTNSIIPNTNVIRGWNSLIITNSETIPADLIFRKTSGKMTIEVRQ